MASNDPDDHRDRPEPNPFVAFRRFADEQLLAALGLFRDSSSTPREGAVANAFEERQRAIWDRFERSFERSMNPERRQIDRQDDVPTDPLRITDTAGRNDDTEEQGGCPMRGVPGGWNYGSRQLEQTKQDDIQAQSEEAVWTRDGMGRAWNLDFFDSSPYSPLQLEKDKNMQQSQVNWRHAFEDLLVADAADYDPHALRFLEGRSPELDRLPAGQWKSVLFQSGLLSSSGSWHDAFTASPMEMLVRMIGSLHDIRPRFPQNELEFYETLAARDGATESSDQVTHSTSSFVSSSSFASEQQQQTSSGKPSILSTLTTTERRTLPDGSTTSRTVLKRRFADGTEESEETSDSTPATRTLPQEPLSLQPGSAQQQEESLSAICRQAAAQKEKRGGWFW